MCNSPGVIFQLSVKSLALPPVGMGKIPSCLHITVQEGSFKNEQVCLERKIAGERVDEKIAAS